MEFEAILNSIKEVGVTLIIIAYFIYRDFKFMSTLQTTLQTLVDTVTVLKEKISRDNRKDDYDDDCK